MNPKYYSKHLNVLQVHLKHLHYLSNLHNLHIHNNQELEAYHTKSILMLKQNLMKQLHNFYLHLF